MTWWQKYGVDWNKRDYIKVSYIHVCTAATHPIPDGGLSEKAMCVVDTSNS